MPEPLSDMSPILLFYMAVVIFAIRPASGELDRLLSLAKVPYEMVIYEFSTVIAVKAKQREGKRDFNVLDLL